MITFRSEDLLVGLISLGTVPWIGWIVARRFRHGRLPIGRGHVRRAERAEAFGVLFAFYGLAGLAMAFIAADLLFGISEKLGL